MLTIDFEKLCLSEGACLLDAGCGKGRHLCYAYQYHGVDVAGVDTNGADLEYACFCLKELAKERSNSWVLEKADVVALPFADGSFDAVICSEVLEHIKDAKAALCELLRVLKSGGRIAISVPNFLPERICWMFSYAYHSEEGGHIRIYKKDEIISLLRSVGLIHEGTRYEHGLHSPYWWLKCFVGHEREDNRVVNLYKKFLEWDIIKKPKLTKAVEKMLNPFIGKSIVLYARKP